MPGSGFFYDVVDHAPNCEFAVWGDFDDLVFRIGRDEQNLVWFHFYTLEGELPIDERHGQTAVVRFDAFIHHENIALGNPLVLHRIAFDPCEERRLGMLYDQVVQIELSFQKIIGRGRESGMDTAFYERYLYRRVIVRLVYFQFFVHSNTYSRNIHSLNLRFCDCGQRILEFRPVMYIFIIKNVAL